MWMKLKKRCFLPFRCGREVSHDLQMTPTDGCIIRSLKFILQWPWKGFLSTTERLFWLYGPQTLVKLAMTLYILITRSKVIELGLRFIWIDWCGETDFVLNCDKKTNLQLVRCKRTFRANGTLTLRAGDKHGTVLSPVQSQVSLCVHRA